MLSKSNIKLINSLKMGKYRRQHQLFIAEGTTNVLDFIKSGVDVKDVYATESWLSSNASQLGNTPYDVVSIKEMGRISALKNPAEVLGMFAIPELKKLELSDINNLVLMLDDIRDPGNLGTIIRTADWFGIQHIICSENTVDAYNPKVVQASMGSLSRVQVAYQDLKDSMKSKPDYIKVFGAVLEGNDILEIAKPNYGIILIGNEAHGISDEMMQMVDVPVTIPKTISNGRNSTAESLNASIATAIMCYEFRRK
jgi:TrmH family RNA methyltransferase